MCFFCVFFLFLFFKINTSLKTNHFCQYNYVFLKFLCITLNLEFLLSRICIFFISQNLNFSYFIAYIYSGYIYEKRFTIYFLQYRYIGFRSDFIIFVDTFVLPPESYSKVSWETSRCIISFPCHVPWERWKRITVRHRGRIQRDSLLSQIPALREISTCWCLTS